MPPPVLTKPSPLCPSPPTQGDSTFFPWKALGELRTLTMDTGDVWTVTFGEELIENGVTESDGRMCRVCYRCGCTCARLGQLSGVKVKHSKEQKAAAVERLKRMALQRRN